MGTVEHFPQMFKLFLSVAILNSLMHFSYFSLVHIVLHVLRNSAIISRNDHWGSFLWTMCVPPKPKQTTFSEKAVALEFTTPFLDGALFLKNAAQLNSEVERADGPAC